MATQRLSSDERRRQILRCAIRVFARRSYYGATTRMISEEAGVAEALIYRYFDSKRALFTAAVEHTSRRLVDEIARVVQAHASEPHRALDALLRYYLELLRRHEDFAKMIFWVSAELDDPEVGQVYLPYQEQALTLLTEAIERWQAAGMIRGGIQPRA
ncbi:MAG: helix-turn-helix domain-containing protein, partial [Myxococcota bacterium]